MASVKDIGGSWVASTDPSTGRTYYANTVSKEVSWEWPAGVPHPDGSGHVFEEVAQGNEWVATLDEGSGQHYYHNRITGETTWTQPEGLTIGGFWWLPEVFLTVLRVQGVCL